MKRRQSPGTHGQHQDSCGRHDRNQGKTRENTVVTQKQAFVINLSLLAPVQRVKTRVKHLWDILCSLLTHHSPGALLDRVFLESFHNNAGATPLYTPTHNHRCWNPISADASMFVSTTLSLLWHSLESGNWCFDAWPPATTRPN